MDHILAAMLGGFLLDLLLGDPVWVPWPHPVVVMGRCVNGLEVMLRENFSSDTFRRTCSWLCVGGDPSSGDRFAVLGRFIPGGVGFSLGEPGLGDTALLAGVGYEGFTHGKRAGVPCPGDGGRWRRRVRLWGALWEEIRQNFHATV